MVAFLIKEYFGYLNANSNTTGAGRVSWRVYNKVLFKYEILSLNRKEYEYTSRTTRWSIEAVRDPVIDSSKFNLKQSVNENSYPNNENRDRHMV